MATIKQALNFHRQGQLSEAEAEYRAILANDTQHFDALHNLGLLKLQQQSLAEARQLIERAVTIRPDSTEALLNLAVVLLALYEPKEALAASDRALRLTNHPGAWATRGNALFLLGRNDEALSSLDEALKIAPNNIEALIYRGTVLSCIDRPDEAVVTFARIPVAQNPANLYRRAQLQQRLGLYAAAARDFRRLIEISPNALPAWMGLLGCASESCDWPALEEPRRKVLAAIDTGQAVYPMEALRYSSNPAQQLKCAMRYAPRAIQGAEYTMRKPARPTRLRIAYVSPDFRMHPLAYLIPQLLECHDRARFEIVGVSLGPPDDSDIRARLIQAFDEFYDLKSSPDDAVATSVRNLDIDIAIDLAGYTEHARPAILARRVAPIQASYLGYCGTSGSRFIDYLVADKIAVPPSNQRFFTEQLVYLPDSFMVADSNQAISEPMPARRECGLPDEGFVFCSFNRNYKILQPVFDVWMRLLHAIDGSVLWLSANLNRGCDNIQRAAKARGIDPQRIVFAPHVKVRADHFARYGVADLFLDTLPYNAHTTACDALFAGLPVLTAMGSAFPGRVAASMLHAIGLSELVAAGIEEYEALALRLARDPARLAAIRNRLIANRRTKPLFDTDRLSRNIEKAYDQMFEIHCDGEPPRSFGVVGQ